MHPPKNDFRQWIVYNSTLKDDSQLYALYKAVETNTTLGNFRCERIFDIVAEKFIITQTGNDSRLTLNADERKHFLSYLKSHYILQDDIEAWMATTNERATAREVKNQEDVPYFLDPRYNNSIQPIRARIQNPSATKMDKPRKTLPKNHSKWFYNPVPRKHILGYALIALLIVQFFVIPTNVFHFKLPKVLEYSYNLAYFVILHIAVRNYRNYFLTGGIRYGTVWAITFWLFFTVFGVIGIELSVIDSLNKGSFSIGYSLIITAALLVAGLFVGWFFSLFVYFINGGKVVTDPATVKAAR